MVAKGVNLITGSTSCASGSGMNVSSDRDKFTLEFMCIHVATDTQGVW